jgi:hypothetical protein
VSPRGEALVRQATRAAALCAPAAGIPLLAVELQGAEARGWVLASAAGLITVGPLLWVLARTPLAVIGASAAFLLGAVLVALGAVREGSDAGFDMGLGICLAAVAVWTLVAHARAAYRGKHKEE